MSSHLPANLASEDNSESLLMVLFGPPYISLDFWPLKVRKQSCLGSWGKCWSQRLVSSQLGSFMFFKTLLMMRSNSFLARCSSSSVLLMRLLSLKNVKEDNKRSMTTARPRYSELSNPFILPQQNASVLMIAEANLFELLHLVFQTVDSVHQTPAATERGFTVRLTVQLQRITSLSLHRCMLAFGHTIIFHLRNCSQSIQTFHVFLRGVNPGLTMAMSSFYKLNQRCRVHTQKEETLWSSLKTLLLLSLCLYSIVVGGIQHLKVKCGCYTYFIFTVTHLPPQAVIDGPANMATVHQKNWCSVLTFPPPPFVRCSWSPRWWSSPPLERASVHPSCWSLMRQGRQCKGLCRPIPTHYHNTGDRLRNYNKILENK